MKTKLNAVMKKDNYDKITLEVNQNNETSFGFACIFILNQCHKFKIILFILYFY